MKSETKEEYFWKITKNLLINSDIIYTTIISSQIILGIDESEQRIFLFHFDEMNEGDLQKINLKIFKDINHYKIRSQDKEINQLMSHFKKKSLDFSERFLVTSDFFHSTIYFLIDSQLFFFNLISWEKHLNYFLAEEDYVNAMINMIQIFKNQIKYLANIPPNSKKRKEILSNSIKEITIDYFLQSTKKIQDIIMDSSYVKEIAITIEFLVETEHFDFLFNNIMKDLELKGFLKQFILSLEPFILKKKIRFQL